MVSESGATLLAVIASLLWPGVLSRPAKTSFHWQLGDLGTWVLALIALLALIAAWLAYRAQSEELADQRKANELQATVLKRTLGAFARQQAEQISVEHDRYASAICGMPTSRMYQRVGVTNSSARPVRHAVCQRSGGHGQDGVRLVGFDSKGGPDRAHPDLTEIYLLRPGETAWLVFPVDTPDGEAVQLVRFTDDAGVHWQVDGDLHLEPLDSRDDW